jgi:hypothetical protein
MLLYVLQGIIFLISALVFHKECAAEKWCAETTVEVEVCNVQYSNTLKPRPA